MPRIIDLSEFNFDGETLMAMNEMLFDEVLEAPELALIHTIYSGVVAKKVIGFVGEGGLVGVANQGCKPTPQDWAIDTRQVIFDPESWEVLIEQCYKDLEAAASVYSLKTGVDMADFTTSDYMNIVIDVLAVALKKFVIRLIWFSDKDAEHFADGGIFNASIPLQYVNILDGFFKQITAFVAANPDRRVTIAENAEATYAAQVLPPAKAQQYLQDLVFGSDLRLRGKSNGFIVCTQSFYDAYYKSLQGIALETMYTNLTDGMRTLTYDGKPLIPMPIWDEMIRMFHDNGAKIINPHRAIYAVKETFGVAVDGENSFSDSSVWYNRDERTVKIESMGRADAKLIVPYLIQVAI